MNGFRLKFTHDLHLDSEGFVDPDTRKRETVRCEGCVPDACCFCDQVFVSGSQPMTPYTLARAHRRQEEQTHPPGWADTSAAIMPELVAAVVAEVDACSKMSDATLDKVHREWVERAPEDRRQNVYDRRGRNDRRFPNKHQLPRR